MLLQKDGKKIGFMTAVPSEPIPPIHNSHRRYILQLLQNRPALVCQLGYVGKEHPCWRRAPVQIRKSTMYVGDKVYGSPFFGPRVQLIGELRPEHVILIESVGSPLPEIRAESCRALNCDHSCSRQRQRREAPTSLRLECAPLSIGRSAKRLRPPADRWAAPRQPCALCCVRRTKMMAEAGEAPTTAADGRPGSRSSAKPLSQRQPRRRSSQTSSERTHPEKGNSSPPGKVKSNRESFSHALAARTAARAAIGAPS